MTHIHRTLLALAWAVSLDAQAPMVPADAITMASPHPASDKVEAPATCARCGMNRTLYAHSRMIVSYEDGAMVGVCSLHCAAIELGANRGRSVNALLVADHSNKKKLVDAKSAIWVIGGSQRGVMTKEPKWAFQEKQDASMFIRMNGGRLASHEEAMEMAAKELMN